MKAIAPPHFFLSSPSLYLLMILSSLAVSFVIALSPFFLYL
jgi:hypothetical protein